MQKCESAKNGKSIIDLITSKGKELNIGLQLLETSLVFSDPESAACNAGDADSILRSGN